MIKFFNFLNEKLLINKQYMILIHKNNEQVGGIWNITDSKLNTNLNKNILHKKFGNWDNSSNINKHIPYIYNDGSDYYITTSLNPKQDPFGTLASTTGLVEPYKMLHNDIIFSVSLWIRYNFKNYSIIYKDFN